MITCTATRWDAAATETPAADRGRVCGAPADVRVTVTGADKAKDLRPGSQPTPWNLDNAPRCEVCAAVDERIVARMFPGATFTETAIAGDTGPWDSRSVDEGRGA